MVYNNKLTAENFPMGIVKLKKDGRILAYNDKALKIIGQSLCETGIAASISGIKMGEIIASLNGNPYPIIKKGDRKYKFVVYNDEEEPEGITIVITDVTSWEDLKDRYNDEKPCLCLVQVDNYDQLIEGTVSSPKLELSSEIDKIIRKWALKYEASVSRIKGSNYRIWFEQRYLDKITESKFEILDSIRNLETTADFPASLSIGIGVGGKGLKQTESFADTALDLALGRGGDQAVVKRGKKIEYFGGRLQAVEKSNKGKSRIVGHALRQLMEQSRNILIMGHKYPDMDCFGAAIGINRLGLQTNKEVYIVIDEVNEGLQAIYEQTMRLGECKIVKSSEALKIADEDSLLVVVDTDIPRLTQCPELLKVCDKVAVIDHHRKTADYIENPILGYIESYASSASELVTEILQYMVAKKELKKIEAEAMLAGIIVDTNNFSMKTGVRTFDAAAWLRRQGADPTEVKRFFQTSYSNVRMRAKAITTADVSQNGVAITVCEEKSENTQILCAQVADQLLTIKDVKASFVVGQNVEGLTVISARSMGDVNVQTIMEKFGGGGHLTTAAAQVHESIEDTVKKIKEIMEV